MNYEDMIKIMQEGIEQNMERYHRFQPQSVTVNAKVSDVPQPETNPTINPSPVVSEVNDGNA